MTGYFASIPEWKTQSEEIISRIQSVNSAFKIVLKIKDDHFFFDRWIRHHMDIVGLENLIIFDNMSTSSKLEEIYESYGQRINLFRFSGFHNNIHRVHEFPELYDALKMSCTYFQFLDSDEYLVHLDEDRSVCRGPEIVDKLIATQANINPASWLENVRGSDRRFWWDTRQNHPVIGLRSGKPIICSKSHLEGLINHNWQVAFSNYSEMSSTRFFVLHLKRLSIEQRIKTNMRKLHSYNAFKGKALSQYEITTLDINDYAKGNKRNWIKEIKDLSLIGEGEEYAPDNFRMGMVEIDGNENLSFSSVDQQREFDLLMDEPWSHIRNAFSDI